MSPVSTLMRSKYIMIVKDNIFRQDHDYINFII